MADKILIKRSLTSGSIPTTASLEEGELALNIPNRLLYSISGSDAIILNTTGSYQINQFDLTAADNMVTVKGTTLNNVFYETAIVDPPISATMFSGASIQYNAQRTGASRSGTVMTSWDDTNLVYTDNSTSDVGDTADISFNLIRIGNEIWLRAYSEGLGIGGWNISFTFTLFPNLL